MSNHFFPDQRGRHRVPTLALSVLSILVPAAALALEFSGYVPCELCIADRWPWCAAVVAFSASLLSWRPARAAKLRAVGVACLLAAAVVGSYHVGVEAGLWKGPSACTGAWVPPRDVGDLLAAARSTTLVRCDVPALVLGGLSLAAWDVVAALVLVLAALLPVRRRV